MKRVITLCLAIAMAVLLASGCQPTPDKPVVVQKDMQQMIEKGMAQSTASQTQASSKAEAPSTAYAKLCASYGVPELFKTSVTHGNLTVNCDIAIELPETGTLPMARVEAGRFSQERVYTLFKALCGDTPMYILPEQADKAYYEKQILEYKAEIAETTDKEDIDFFNGALKDVEKQYEAAPDHIKLVPADGTLETKKLDYDTDKISGSFTSCSASSAPFEDNAMSFFVQNDPEYEKDGVYTFIDEYGNTNVTAPRSCSRFLFEREGKNSEIGGGYRGRVIADATKLSLSGGAVDNCMLSTTPQQARKTVEAFLEQTGIDDMAIDTVSLYSNKYKPPTSDEIEDMKQEGGYIEDTRPETYAYVFRLLRRVNGVNVESILRCSSQTSVEGMDYGKEWYYEWMSIAVDDKGIANVYWEAPLDIKEIMTEDTAIRPWSEIEDIFEKMIMVKFEYDANSSTYTTVLDLTHVSLTLRRIMERDSYSTGLLVPVWNFFGTCTSQEGQEEPDVSNDGDFPLMTINAIDGSVIDVSKGY